MDAEKQNNIWNLLSPEDKLKYQKLYSEYIKVLTEGEGFAQYEIAKTEGKYEILYEMFGEHNLLNE